MNPIKRLLQSLTATPEVMREVAEIDAQFANIEACGTSRDDALRMALKCAQIGLTPDDIEPMARMVHLVGNPYDRTLRAAAAIERTSINQGGAGYGLKPAPTRRHYEEQAVAALRAIGLDAEHLEP